jgi:tetratricopeptide (TPR) repeat protein
MVEGCQQVSDFQRMKAWTRALTQWCRSQPDLVAFTGQSAVHRAQIMRAEGAFRQALEELALAVERYHVGGFDPAEGLALYERGEVLRLLGDGDGAESAYAQASALGCEPQPGLALLWLAKGRTAAAVSAAQRLLWETVGDVPRSRVLPAAVEILLAAQEREAARAAAEELAAIAARFGCQAVRAMAACALGCVRLEEGDPEGALPHLRRAWKSWIDLGARYEAARARTQIGLAFRLHGDGTPPVRSWPSHCAPCVSSAPRPPPSRSSACCSDRFPTGSRRARSRS